MGMIRFVPRYFSSLVIALFSLVAVNYSLHVLKADDTTGAEITIPSPELSNRIAQDYFDQMTTYILSHPAYLVRLDDTPHPERPRRYVRKLNWWWGLVPGWTEIWLDPQCGCLIVNVFICGYGQTHNTVLPIPEWLMNILYEVPYSSSSFSTPIGSDEQDLVDAHVTNLVLWTIQELIRLLLEAYQTANNLPMVKR